MESRGKVNAYVCCGIRGTHGQLSRCCGKVLVTINLNAGTTPFMMGCPDCAGMAQSSFYRFKPSKEGAVTVDEAWYRPRKEEFQTLDSDSQDHVLRGGLLHKPLSEVEPLLDDFSEDWDVDRVNEFMLATYGRKQ